jgi:hypothetical protein
MITIGGKKISAFDVGIIIAFVVITLIGGGACYYLYSQLNSTLQDVGNTAGDFDKYSSREVYLPTGPNQKVLEQDIALMHAQLDPLIKSQLQAPGNKLPSAKTEDTVAWKHDLDAEVASLNNAAKLHGVTVPNHFYYGFSRYLNTNPSEEATEVLTKQLYGIQELANIFINAPVKTIYGLSRTYEESSSNSLVPTQGVKGDPEMISGRAQSSPGHVYTAYPFDIEFETSTENFRKIVDALQKSPYVFVIRSVTLKNSASDSPENATLDKLAAPPENTPTDANGNPIKVVKGPQFLFGNETLHIKMRIDMIEWNGVSTGEEPASTSRPSHRGAPGGGRPPGGDE